MTQIRLNKFIAHHGGYSRRQADDLIVAKKVTLNGSPATIGDRVTVSDKIEIDGKPLKATVAISVLMNKPTNYVCSRRRQGDTPTIYELLPESLHTLKPAGRLDSDSSGLLLLTTDGDLAFRMTHPKFHKQKTYLVSLDRDLEPLHQQMISDFGIQLEDGPSKLLLHKQTDTSRKDWVVSMHEGRNRQIRRTFAALGYTVTQLHRTQFGEYTLDALHGEQYIKL